MIGNALASRMQAILLGGLALACVGSLRAGAQTTVDGALHESRHLEVASSPASGSHGEPLPPGENPLPLLAGVACLDGFAGPYPCHHVDLQARLLPSELGGTRGNDIWGWTDPLTGGEHALLGLSNGTAFVDVSDPERPVHLGNLATHTQSSTWRDIKVHAGHAFVVSEANGHGMQIFDLTQLRGAVSPARDFVETTHYERFGSAHNIFINEDTAYAYVVGTRTCGGGLHMLDVQDPVRPSFAGCFAADGYTHDVQCVVYTGPDADYQEREICFAYNEDTLTIVDVTDKSRPTLISRKGYGARGYTHQGWLTEDQSHLLMDDELDERFFGLNTRTLIWNVSNLDAPFVASVHSATTRSIDHNQYVVGQHAFQSNYRAGLRILDLGCAAEPDPQEVAFFDVYPPNNNRRFSGSWSNYPFFESGTVVVSSIEQGLFVLHPRLPCTDTLPPVAVARTEDLHCVWPPNGRQVCFGREDFAPEVSDDCGEVAWEFAGCESDQPAAAARWFPGPPADDCRVEADRICVRAERAGSISAGRRYAVRIVAVDSCGNRSAETTIGSIHVPHDLAQGCAGGP